MSLELYSDLLTIATLVVTIHAVAWLAITLVNPTLRNLSYRTYIALAGILALIATISALVYQYVYHLPVCELCWWQRIFMFPIEVVVVTSLIMRARGVHVTVAALACFGALIAAYHYWLHLNEMVLGRTVSAPCSAVGLTPSCSASHILSFGFMTIPGMALLVFIAIFVLCVLAMRTDMSNVVE